MELRVTRDVYSLGSPIAYGGEGTIYVLGGQLAAKVYHPELQTEARRQKVLALCNKYEMHQATFGTSSFAFPQQPAFEMPSGTLVGLSMAFHPGCPSLTTVGYDLAVGEFRESAGNRLTDARCIGLAYRLFELLAQLHRARVVLGDVNLGNILLDLAHDNPIYIDLDSSQVERYGCEVYSEEYLDPRVEEQGVSLAGHFSYTCESDVFSMACIAYELFVGANPYTVRTRPARRLPQNKREGVSLLRCHVEGERYLSDLNVSLVACEPHSNALARIAALATLDPKLHDFLVATLVHGDRANLMTSLPISDPRHPAFRFYDESGIGPILEKYLVASAKPTPLPSSGIDTILRQLGGPRRTPGAIHREEDPPAFAAFLANYGVDLSALGVGGAGA